VRQMAVRFFGELKGPLVLTILLMLCVATPVLLLRSSSSLAIPKSPTASITLSLAVNFALSYGLWIVIFLGFLAVWEKQRSLKEILFSVGFRKKGLGKSVFWALVFLIPALLVSSLVLVGFSGLLGSISLTQAANSSGVATPSWYLIYIIIYSFFPVALFEEALGRGYMLDRLMPKQPCGLKEALPAIVLSSVLFSVFHLPAYFLVYTFSHPWAIVLWVANVFPTAVFLSMSYVRSHTRNIGGAVLAHFLMDSLPYIFLIV